MPTDPIILTDADPKPAEPPRIFFSVLVCGRNASPYVDECLASIQAQTFPSWEALVCDDASTDDTLAKITAKVGDDPRFRIYHNDVRQTALPNLMHLITEARGDHIALIDLDDYVTPEALNLHFSVYNDAPAVACTSGSYARVPDGGRGHCRAPQPGEAWWNTWLFGHLLTWRRQLSLDSFREEPESYLDVDGKPYRSAYDIPLYFAAVARAELAGKRVAHVNNICYFYRRHADNDDSSHEGLDLQGRCATRAATYWGNRIYQWERQAAR